MTRKIKTILAAILMYSTVAPASDFNWKLFDESGDARSIGDGEHKFSIGDWSCIISEVSKDKQTKSETRRLGCGIGDGLQVYVSPRCGTHIVTKQKVEADVASFNLQQKKTGARSVVWSCSK